MTDINAQQLSTLLTEVRSRTLALVADLSDEQMIGPQLSIVNPPLWEIGHVAWFQEKWALRHLRGLSPTRPGADALYDSAAIPHDTRWDLWLPTRPDTLSLMQQILDLVVEHLGPDPLSERETYFHLLALFHEDMHDEALTYTRQTLGYAPPKLAPTPRPSPKVGGGVGERTPPPPAAGPLAGDVEVPGGIFELGAARDEPFVFDNEKWGHLVDVRPFRIARAAVTNAEFAAFVDDGGYREPQWWSEAGWRWRQASTAEHPVYWQPEAPGRWLRRHFDTWGPLEPHLAIIHVNWYEAQAYCNWAGRRLPTEAEWEFAASASPTQVTPNPRRTIPSSAALQGPDGAGWHKRRFPWGDDPPTPERANLDSRALGCIEVGALPGGDSYFGCRQMIGNVWEWTADTFLPYPGFLIDPYKEYSEPWFRTHKVLRGGCWTTRSRLIRNTWRNFYTPDRRDVLAGFRTCARDG